MWTCSSAVPWTTGAPSEDKNIRNEGICVNAEGVFHQVQPLHERLLQLRLCPGV